jgi:hypothetical protein
MASTNIFLLHHSYFADVQPCHGIGHEESNFIDDLLATLQTYQMEFDPHCVCVIIFYIFYLSVVVDK